MGKALLNNSLFHALLIIGIASIIYSNTFHVPFQFDEKNVIVENPILKDLQYFSAPSKAKIFKHHFGYHTFRSRYIGYLTFAMNYRLHGLDVPGYHIVNLVIHISTALLIYTLVRLTFKTPFLLKSKIKDSSKKIALFTTLLFVCHPIQTEAVTYIWQRVASLAALFYILSLVTYVKWRLSFNTYTCRRLNIRDQSFFFLSIIAAIFAMKTKQIAFTLPITVALYEIMFFQENLKKRTLYLFPLFLTMPIIPLTLVDTDKPIGDIIGDVGEASRDLTGISRLDYLCTQFRVFLTYLRLIFLPIKQNLDYDYPVYRSILNPEVFLSFTFLLILLCSGIYLLHRFRHTVSHVKLISFGIFWFFITLSVESSIIPIKEIIFEYRMYLPSVGLFLVFSTLLFMIAEKYKERWKNIIRVVPGMLTVAVVVLAVSTYERNTIWRDEITLWEDVVSKSPNKSRGHNNLGRAYISQGLTNKAREQFKIAIQINPYDSIAHTNLGVLSESQGLIKEAVQHYQSAIAIHHDNIEAYNNLGNIYLNLNLTEKAIEHYEMAMKGNPGFAEARYNLGISYSRKGLTDLAIEHYRAAIQLKPEYADAYINLGNLHLKKGDIDIAIGHLEKAIRINPYSPQAHLNLGIALKNKGLKDKANEHFSIARRLNPAFFKTGRAHH